MAEMQTRRTGDRWLTSGMQVGLVVLAVVLLRWASIRWNELVRQGRSDFDMGWFFGWGSIWLLLIVAVAAASFTVAMRIPLARGFRWGPALWALVPFALTQHPTVYYHWAGWAVGNDFVRWLVALDSTTMFLDDASVRWVLAALAGVGLGCATGRSAPLASSGSVVPEPAARAEDPGLKVPAEERPGVPS